MNPPKAVCGAGNFTLQEGECILVANTNTSHRVLLGLDEIVISCYSVSNACRYGENCSVNYSDGPSFFDRLDGRYTLSEKYMNQSINHFNNSLIGIETFVDFAELDYHAITVHLNATWVDYLYWQGVNGSKPCAVCETNDTYLIQLDCPHVQMFDIDVC